MEDRRLLAVIGNNISVGDELQHYRLAIAATAEYTSLMGGQPQALTAIQTFVGDINEIFEAELSIHFDLVSDSNTVFTDAGTDGYTNGDTNFMIAENTPILDGVLGNAGYDIGHVFGTKASGGSGLAGLGVVNVVDSKGRGASVHSNPQGPDWVNLVAHEIAHQFGAQHSFNANAFASAIGNRSASNAYEPASGSTIMSYAGISGADNLQGDVDSYFHSASYEEIQTYIAGAGTPHSTTVTGNSIPTVSGGANFTIPAGTPFELTAVGADSDPGDSLTYTWEQLDLGTAMSLPLSDNGSSPLFRSFEPTAASSRVFPRLSDLLGNVNTTAIGEVLPTTTRSLNFRSTVRDGNGGVGSDDVLISVVNTGTPFAITSPNTAVNWTGGSSQTITWNVGGTDTNGINTASVAIELSLDGGQTYLFDLASSTSNDGSHTLDVPNIDTNDARIRVRGIGNIFFDTSNANFSITSDAGAPGVTVTESGGNTAVSEDGVVGGVGVDTYTLALNTAPAGTVSVTVTADAQTEVSLDGTSFFSSVVVAVTSTSSQTIHVRASDDGLLEGIHSGLVTQVVTSSTDANYPLGTLISPVAVSIADDELQPVVGVDFDDVSGASPTNWTRVSQQFGGTTSNLIREDGITTGIGLTLGVGGSAGLNFSTAADTPLHSPSLDLIDGNHLATESLTLTWTGLVAGTDYNVYLLLAENFGSNVLQSVTITGGAGNPLPFTQDTQSIGNGLLVNGGLADSSKTLEADAVIAQADSNGEIKIVVSDTSVGGIGNALLAGAAIQELGPETIGFSVIAAGGAMSVSETGTTDSFNIVLMSQPTDDVVIDVASSDVDEAIVGPTSLTFTTTDWNIPQTVTVTGVDDVLTDGAQTSIITMSIDEVLTLDDAFDSVGDRLVTVSTQDNEATSIVGVDFDLSGSPPTNWTSVTDKHGSTTNNLIREDGTTSPFDLTVAVSGGANVVDTSAPTNLPDHTPSLSGLDGVRFSVTSLTLTWTGLSAGTDYDLYLFAAEPYSQNAIQTVTISGGGTNPAPFSMDTSVIGSSLLVNSVVASPSRTLLEDAVRATANGSGEIEVAVVNNGGDFVFLSGAAIQEVVAATPISADLSVTTHGHETGPVDVVYTVTLNQNNDTGGAITFDLDDLLTGSATSGSDYTAVAANAQITVPEGASIGTLTVPILDDMLLESSETVIAQISNPSVPAIVIGNASATAIIVDNDATLSIAATNAEQNEGDSGNTNFSFTVTRTGDTSGAASVNYAITGDVDAADFGGTLPNGTINFVTGETNKLITLQVSGDTVVEADENFTVTLSAASGATLGTLNASGIIQNDDVPTPSFAFLDTNEDNSVDASTDGNLILVTLFGLPEANLTPFRGNTTLTNTQIADTIQQLKTDLTLDVNNDGMVDASTDGNLILVNLFGLPDSNLTPFRGATTLTNVEIRQNIEALKIVPTAPLMSPLILSAATDSKLDSADTLTQGIEESISGVIAKDASVQERRLDLLSLYTYENENLKSRRNYGPGDQTVRHAFGHRVPARTQIATDRINAIVDTVATRQTPFNSQSHHLVFAEFDDLFTDQIFYEILENGEAVALHIDDLFAVI